MERRAHVLGTRDRACARVARLEITCPHCVIAADQVILEPLLILGIYEEIRGLPGFGWVSEGAEIGVWERKMARSRGDEIDDNVGRDA